MIHEVGEIINLDNKKLIILTNIVSEGVNYSFTNEVSDNEEDITENFYLVKYNPDNTLSIITDETVVDGLFPQIQEGLKKSMADNGIDLDNLSV